MAVSLDYYLRSLASQYYLKNDSEEIRSINTSLESLFKNLESHFTTLVNRKFVFGSYDRDTILPRKFDSKSDVDIMIIFNHTDYERTPETYRTWLKAFADKYYKDRYGSDVVKTFPTVSVRLGHIYYDLVPAKEETFGYATEISIPGNFGWRTTNPHDVKKSLVDANTRYDQIVRPIIRLFKAWNCYNDYPYDSYLLELELIGMNFWGDNVQTGFIYAVKQLGSNWNDPQSKTTKLQSLKYNIGQVEQALNEDNLDKAKQWLHRVLPTP